MPVALPQLIKTDRRAGGLRLWRWRLLSRPIYIVAEPWTWTSLAAPGLTILIPAGFETDLVSAPGLARPLMPLHHLAAAALVHDWLRRHRPDLSLEQIDALMLLVMVETGVPEPWRTIVWLSVRTNNNRA